MDAPVLMLGTSIKLVLGEGSVSADGLPDYNLRNAQIILGSIVTQCPSMSLAPSALVQLDSACDLFAKAANFFQAEKVLVRVL